ncbi:MAG: hypothetical protein IJD97_02250 [Clostridia bacterium]|nr:hypothetical protein [Clostridia bacterium]
MNMKKILATLLAVVMVLGTTGVSFANDDLFFEIEEVAEEELFEEEVELFGVAEATKVTTFAGLKNALAEANANVTVGADITIDEALSIPEGVTVTVAAEKTLRVLDTLTNNGTINGDGTVSVDTMVYVVETVTPYEGVSYDVTATKNGTLVGTAPGTTVTYEISLDGGDNWFADTTNGTAEAVLAKADGTKTVYASFQTAYTSARNDDVVYMLTDAHVQSKNAKNNYGPLFSYYGLTLEGNGHTIYTDLEANGAATKYSTIKFASYASGAGTVINPVIKNVTIDSQNNSSNDIDVVANGNSINLSLYNVNMLCKSWTSLCLNSKDSTSEANLDLYDCSIKRWDVSSGTSVDIYSGEYTHALNNKCTVYGGTYTKDPTNYLAEGVKVEKINESYNVVPDPAYGMVAKIGDEYFETIDDALKTAVNGDEIILVKDIEISKSIVVKNGITFNGNEYTITPAADFAIDGHGAAFVIDAERNDNNARVATEYTVKNVAFSGFSGMTRVLRANFADINIENCTFEGNSVSEGIITSAYADLDIKDCVFKSNNSAFVLINIGADVDEYGTEAVADITDNTFVENNAAVAGVYLVSSANVTGNHFKGNVHTGDNANGAAILAGPYAGTIAYSININENAFDNAMTRNGAAIPAVYAEDWSDSYDSTTAFDFSSNYWDGKEPAKGVAYESNVNVPVITFADYYEDYSFNAEGELMLSSAEDFAENRIDAVYLINGANETGIATDLYDIYALRSLEVKIYAGATHIATTEWKRSYPILIANDYLSCASKIIGTSGSWATEWIIVPNEALIPTKVVLVIDDVETSTYDIWNSNINYDSWKALGGVGTAKAAIGETRYHSLQAAVEAVKNGEEIVILEDFAFTEGANGTTNGISYTGDASFTINLNGKTITSDLGNNALRFKIGDGNSIENTNVEITVKNGKIVSGDNNWCAISAATAENSGNKLTLNLEDLDIKASKAGDYAVKSWAGAVVNAKNVDIEADMAGGFYAVGGEIVLENCTVDQKGLHTAPYLSMAAAVSNLGKMTIKSGTYSTEPKSAEEAYNQGTSHGSWAVGVMNSGGTLIINGGTFSNGNFGDDALATYARGLVFGDKAAEIIINGGTFNALDEIIDLQNNLGTQPNPTATLAGGTFSADPTKAANNSNLITVAEGFQVTKGVNIYKVVPDEAIADKVYVQFRKTDVDANGEDNLEGKDIYEIVLAGKEEKINELASADLTFVFDPTPLDEDGEMSYFITPAKGVTLSQTGKKGEEHRYMFNYDGVTKDEETGSAIVIGEITIEGYGDYKLSTAASENNAVYATTIIDNLVDGYKAAAELGINEDMVANDGMVGEITNGKIEVPVRTLTINVTFPNNIKENVAAYQNMTVKIAGGNVDKTVTLGSDWADLEENTIYPANVTLSSDATDASYVVTVDLPFNTAYMVTVEGDGYRTARYTVKLTEAKTLNFWNNVMDGDNMIEVEEDAEATATTKTFLAGDIVKDNQINVYDLSAVVSYFGKGVTVEEAPNYAKYDLDRNGVIDARDVAYVLVSWGE